MVNLSFLFPLQLLSDLGGLHQTIHLAQEIGLVKATQLILRLLLQRLGILHP